VKPYFDDGTVSLYVGDCLDVLAGLPDASVDAVVTDPPYGLEFMGREWDTFRPSQARIRTRTDGRANPAEGKPVTSTPGSYTARQPFQGWCLAWSSECLRVLKPGGHLLAFGGTRTWHRLACAVEDAGFEIRDSISWLYGSGFPKSKNLGGDRTGWGTALKPAHEPVVVARKPLAGTVEANMLVHGTGALNIGGCRIAHAGEADRARSEAANRHADRSSGPRENHILGDMGQHSRAEEGNYDGSAGRWPPNVLLSHPADCGQAYCAPGCPVAELDRQSGSIKAGGGAHGTSPRSGTTGAGIGPGSIPMERSRNFDGYGDTGGASRFFPAFRWQAKAPASERPRLADGTAHPTVKPLELMRWLVRLVTPPGGLVLDPFAGSGTTAEACVIEGFRCVLAEKDPASAELIKARLAKPIQPAMFGEAS
jgi:site-specific DNA-methyltransferase (adenine-specific)